MATFQKFDPHAFLDRRGPEGLAAFAALAAGTARCAATDPPTKEEIANRDEGLRCVNGQGAVAKVANAANVQQAEAAGNRRDTTSSGRRVTGFDTDTAEIAAVLLRGTIIGDCWLVADHEALAEYPEILRAGLPVVFFDELEQLRGKTAAELQAIGLVKSIFPTGRVLQ